ncbi:hypothetical protein [Pseudomonas sp. NBRC 111124]|uniref:hypothetical protein n=1 Tax=Pseudomonas sp. NBRC 111124 TaxID=1661039 RepID=UPI0012E22BFC|nr:hypothetical protein [Pseudomonas sp. NBRC 111124]
MHPLLTDGSFVSALSAEKVARSGGKTSDKNQEIAKNSLNFWKNLRGATLQTIV